MENQNTKICPKCKVEKELPAFAVDRSKKNGYQSFCKSCSSRTSKKYREVKDEKKSERILLLSRYKNLNNKINDPIKLDIDTFRKIVLEMDDLLLTISGKETNKFTIMIDSLGENSSSAEFIIPSKLQLFLVQKKQIILQPMEISISHVGNKINVSLPNYVKLNNNSINEFIETLG
ncbi:MAG: hypothetical protein WC755_06190 [Candidatus Woesearchaeota archaeon]|jgi:hypothetical protein